MNSPKHPKLYEQFHFYLDQYGSERSTIMRELMAAYVRRASRHGVPSVPFELVEGAERSQEKPGRRYGPRKRE